MYRPKVLIRFIATVALLCVPTIATAANAVTFVSENYPDGTVVSPGQSFTKTWTVRNSGTTTWTSGYKLRWVSGASLSNHADVAVVGTVAPGSNYTFSVSMTAPSSSGTYREDWKIINSSGATITVNGLWVSIKVSAGTDAVTFVSENYPDGTVVNSGQGFTKTWTVRNSGTTTWTSGYKLRWVSGANLSNHVDVAVVGTVAPGSNYTFSVSMTAPSSSGTYREDWKIINSSGATITVNGLWVSITAAAKTYSLSGTIKDVVTGSALRGASVTIGSQTVSADATGYYFIGQLANTSQTLTASQNGYVTQSATVNPAVSPTRDFQLQPDATACTSGTVSGVVSDASTGQPKSGVTVSLNNSSTPTNTNGQFTFTNIATGTRALKVSLSGYSDYNQNAFGCGNTTQDIRLAKNESVQGTQIKSGLSPDPVNTATGNYVYQRQDLKLPGKGFGFVFERTYNSQDASSPAAVNGPLGFGWSHAYSVSRTINSSSGVDIRWGDSKVESYTPNGSGGFTAPFGVFDTLTASTGGTLTLTKKNQMVYLFDASGRLTSIADRNGNTLALTYTSGNLSSITDTAGRNINFTYDASGHLTKITDPINRTVQFAYDTAGNMISAIDARGQTTQYTYDASHQLLTFTDPRGNVVVSNTYDNARRVVTVQKDAKGGATSFVYDPLNRKTTFADALGHVTTHYYDDHLRLIREDDPNDGIARYTYDAAGNRIAVVGKNGNLTAYEYDPKGNVTKKTDALQQVTTIAYSASNDPLTRTDALGQTTTYRYDSMGNLTSTTDALNQVVSVTYSAVGLPLAVTDARGNATTNAYDAQGNRTSVTDALGNITSYTYDGAGRRISKKDAFNRTTTYAYDAGDNLLSTTDPTGKTVTNVYDENGNRTSVTDKRGSITQFSYDQKDLLTTTADALGQQLIYGYDALDRRISVKDKRGNVTASTYDGAGNLLAVTDGLNGAMQFTYDLNGNRIGATDALGHASTFTYDALNRRTTTTDALANTSITTYDALGRVSSTTNAKGQVTSLEYDAVGRLTKVTDAAGGTVTYTYDANGNRLTMTDPRGKVTSYGYDKLNRLVSKTEPLANVTRYEYDTVGNLTKLTRPNGTIIQYAYDALDRVSMITYSDASGVALAYDANGNRTQVTNATGASTFTYDVLNRMLAYTNPFGQQVGYGYDANGNRTSLIYPGNKTATYVYDVLNRMTGVTDWQGRTTAYTYDAASRLGQTLNPNGTSTTLGYDNANRLTQLTNAGGAQTIASYAYTLDPLGNHSQATVNEPLSPSIAAATVNYGYDDENRLTSAGGISFTYDADGNLTAKGPDSFAYDFEDRLKQSTIGGVAASYQYDGTGNRLAKTVGGATTRYVLDLNGSLSKVLMETDLANTPTAYYLHGLGLVARIKPDGTASYYHYDSRGSTVALTDQTGNITDAYAYDAFGKPAGSQGATANPFRYVGRYGVMDEGNGLAYIRARYYDPDAGRFISKDPKAGNDQDGQSLNRYVYAANNPVIFIDVSGFNKNEVSQAAPAILGSSDPSGVNNWLTSERSEQAIWPLFSTAFGMLLGEAADRASKSLVLTAINNAVDAYRSGNIFEALTQLNSASQANKFNTLGKTLGRVTTLLQVLISGNQEIQRSGGYAGLLDISGNVAFAVHNPDAAIQAFQNGSNSVAAVALNALTGNAFKLTGTDIGNAVQMPGNALGTVIYNACPTCW